eukprot:133608_1
MPTTNKSRMNEYRRELREINWRHTHSTNSMSFENIDGLSITTSTVQQLIYNKPVVTVRKPVVTVRKPAVQFTKNPPPEIAKYIRMVTLKIPFQVVKNKMKRNGDGNRIEALIDWINPPPAPILQVVMVSKLHIELKHMFTVAAYCRIGVELNVGVPQDIFDLVLFFYAKPIVMHIKMTHNYGTYNRGYNIKHILFCPVTDSYKSIYNKIRIAFQCEVISWVDNRFKESNFDSWRWDEKDLFQCRRKHVKAAPEKFKIYCKMIKLKIPFKIVKNKMIQNGDDPQELVDFLTNTSERKNDLVNLLTFTFNMENDPPEKLKIYFRMVKMKIPLNVVKNKMKLNGYNPQELVDWLTHKKLKEYCKMIKLKIPLNVVENKMKNNGHNPEKLVDWIKLPLNELPQYIRMIEMNAPLSLVTNKIKFRKIELALLVFNAGIIPKDKAEITPNKKMKALHWRKIVQPEIKNTIWDGIDDTEINIDTEEFESMFQRNIIRKTRDKFGKDLEEIHLIDGKRSHNVDVGLSTLKLSHQQIKNAILLMDEKVLDLNKVIELRNYIPDIYEQDILRHFDGDVSLLAYTERFFLALCNIPDLTTRMELFQFKLQFKQLIALQRDKINILRKAHDNVKHCKSFKIILQYILAFGNYMNGGTFRGQAFGFELSSLKQIWSVKSIDNNTTLLHYIHMEIENKNRNALKFIDDFEILAEASKLNIVDITNEVNKIGMSINKIYKKLYVSPSLIIMKNDRFADKMSLFLSSAELYYTKLKNDHDSIKMDCLKLAEFFLCKNDTTFEYFKDLYEFMVRFKTIGLEIQRKRQEEAINKD